MVSHSYGLVPPVSLGELFKPIEKADEAKFKQFYEEVISGGGFHDDSEERRARVGLALDVSVADAGLLLDLLKGIYDRFRHLEENGATFDDLFSSFLVDGLGFKPDEDGGFSEAQQLVNKLASLFSSKENLDERSKVSRLEKGFSDSATGFNSIVDLRPNFSRDRKSIIGYIPVVHLQIKTDSEMPNKQQIIIALDSEALIDLQNALTDIKIKIDRLANQEYLIEKIYTAAGKN
jgi:hypothetical protein